MNIFHYFAKNNKRLFSFIATNQTISFALVFAAAVPFVIGSYFTFSVTANNRSAAQSTTQPAAVAGEQARQSEEFVESIGVNVHLGYDDGIYGNYNGVVKPRLQELGIRHIRDGIDPVRTDVTAKLKDLHNTLGIKSTLLTSYGRFTPAEAHSYLKNQLGVQTVAAVEGINEPDLFIAGCCWVAQTRAFTQQLYEAVKGDPATAHLPVVAPSVTTTQAIATIGSLTPYADFGNIHNYYGARMPETSGWGDNGYGSLTWNINYIAQPIVSGKPAFATETGYHNAHNTLDGHAYTPEGVTARYLPRLFLNHFNGGIVKSHIYELLDVGTDTTNIHDNYGLVRNNNTVKPSFTTLKNLIAVLSDRGPGFTPGALDYNLSGNTANLRHTLLQKRDGRFYLVLWVAAQRWNPVTRVESDIPTQSVTVHLNTSTARARTFLPLNSAAATQDQANPTSLVVSVPDHPLIIELTPNSGTPPPPPTSLPAPWQTQDIGSVGFAGSASHSNGTFTVRGSGADIWNAADGFRYVYQPLAGNGEIVARVAGIQNTDSWAKAGVMIRETLTAGSKHALMIVTPSNGVSFQRRVATGGGSNHSTQGGASAPYWVKLTRSGNTLSGYASSNGANWTLLGSETIAMTSDVYIGLAVTSHNNSAVNQSAFDNVSVTGSTTSPGITDGTYRLIAESSGKALDVYGISTVDGANVVQWTSNGGVNQQWRVERQSGGDYRLTAMHSGKSLDIFAAGTNDGADVIQWTWHGGANQRWQIVAVGNGYYKLLPSNAPSKALDVAGASAADGADVRIWTDNGSSGQRWRLEPIN